MTVKTSNTYLKILTIVGCRPQFIKAAPVSRLLRQRATEILVHTGQHYDDDMSEIFFTELKIPPPDYNLKVGSGSHGQQTGSMLARLEEVMLKEKPNWVLVYGDTNSTLAGALAAAKLHIPVAHVEAGLRSYNRVMPEEINRVITDHLSRLLFAPTQTAVSNLSNEGINNVVKEGHLYPAKKINNDIFHSPVDNKTSFNLPHTDATTFSCLQARTRKLPKRFRDCGLVINTGDVMLDALNFNCGLAAAAMERKKLHYVPGSYYLATIHRAENTNFPEVLRWILEAFISLDKPVVFPMHPRTHSKLVESSLQKLITQNNIRVISPEGYLEMISLQKNAAAVITDSGGVQKEAFLLNIPCLTLRSETEWEETLEGNWNRLLPPNPQLPEQLSAEVRVKPKSKKAGNPFGDGRAAERIVSWLT